MTSLGFKLARLLMALVWAASCWPPSARAQSAPCVQLIAPPSDTPDDLRAALARELEVTVVDAAVRSGCATLQITRSASGAHDYRLTLRRGTQVRRARTRLDDIEPSLRARALALSSAGLWELLYAPPQSNSPDGPAAKDAAPAAVSSLAGAPNVPLERVATAPQPVGYPASSREGTAPEAARWQLGAAVGTRWLMKTNAVLPMIEARGALTAAGLRLELGLLGWMTWAEHALGRVTLYGMGLRPAALWPLLRGPRHALLVGPQLTAMAVRIGAKAAPNGTAHDALRPALSCALRGLLQVRIGEAVRGELTLEVGLTPVHVRVLAGGETLLRVSGPWSAVSFGIGI